MTTYQLNADQMIQLKGMYLCETQENVSYGELADADTLVSDSTIHSYYEGTCFVEDDFGC